jgi:P-type conjugative transfer protein TrbJ
MKLRFLVVLVVVLVSTSARAQLAVFDPANFVQNSLTAARTLMEVNNQLKQLANEATMLINDARNLATLPFNIVAQLKQTLALTNQLIAQAQGIGFQLSQTNAQFGRFYPPSYASGITGFSMAQDSYQRWINSFFSLYTTLAMQSQAAQNLAADENALATLVSQSQGAIGIVQAAQATNQLLALHARQTIQEQQLRLTQDRTAALEHARTVVAETRAREVRHRFEGSGVRYTPQPINFYGF